MRAHGLWIIPLRTAIGVFRIIVVCASSQASSSSTAPNRIPIGSLFDNESVLFRTAFKYEYERHNNGSSSVFKLDPYFQSVDISDSFDVLKSLCSTISKGTFALVGVTHRSTFNSIDAFSRTFHMPYVTPSSPSNDSLTGGLLAHYTAAILPLPPPPSSGGLTLSHGVHSPSGPLAAPSPGTPSTSGFTLYMRPLYDRAIVDVIKYYKWPKIFYIYDTSEGLMRLEHLHHVINTQDIRLEISAVRLTEVDQSYMVLRQVDAHYSPDGCKYIVLDLSSDEALQSVLRQIQGVGMNRASYHYLLGGLAMDEIDLIEFRHGGVNITGFTLLNRNSSRVQTLQKDWARLNSTVYPGAGNGQKLKMEAALTMDSVSVIIHGLTALLNVPDQDIFRGTFRRGQVYNNDGNRGIECRKDPKIPWIHGEAIMKSLKEVRFHGATGNVAFDEYGFRKDYKLGVYELNLDTEPKEIGVWDYNKGLNISRAPKEEEEVEKKPVNRTRIITSIISPPYLSKKTKVEDKQPLQGNAQFEGYCADMAEEIARIVGFTYELRLVEDGKYGEKTEIGTWNGMVGELTRKKADLAIAPLTITSIRERVIDFSKPFMNLGISIMIKKPEKQKPGVFSFMDPLASDIWLCIVISYLGVSFVLFLVSRFSPYEWQIEDRESGPGFTNDFTILNSLWFSLGAFMRQGCDISPRSLSGRIVGSAWWFFTLIIISSYTANLAAFLTVERMLTPIESADDLAKQREIQYGTLQSGSTKDFFKNSKIATYERMWEFMSNNPEVFVGSTAEGVTKVRQSKGKYAFLLESTMNDYYNQKKNCNTMKVGGDLDSKGYGVATPIGSDLRERIGLAVLQMLENGFLQKLHKKWWYDKGECVSEDSKGGSSQSALTLSNVAGIFYILIAGLGLSMLMSLLEFFYKSHREDVKQKKLFSKTAAAPMKTRMSTGVAPDKENGGYAYSGPTQVTAGFQHGVESHTQV